MKSKRNIKLIPIEVRFMSKVEKTDTCWNWKASCHKIGYGDFRVGKNMRRAHRVSYTLFVGEIPDNKKVLHKCDNRRCVNPDHLFLGTQKDNMIDMIKKGRDASKRKIDRVGISALIDAIDSNLKRTEVASYFKLSISRTNTIYRRLTTPQ